MNPCPIPVHVRAGKILQYTANCMDFFINEKLIHSLCLPPPCYLHFHLPHSRCNALEVPHDEDYDHPQLDLHANHMYLHFTPFQIVSLLLTL